MSEPAATLAERPVPKAVPSLLQRMFVVLANVSMSYQAESVSGVAHCEISNEERVEAGV